MEENCAFEFYIIFMSSFKDVHSNWDFNMNFLSIFINKDNVYSEKNMKCMYVITFRQQYLCINYRVNICCCTRDESVLR